MKTFEISLNALQANMYRVAWQGYTIHALYCGSFDLLEQVDKGTSLMDDITGGLVASHSLNSPFQALLVASSTNATEVDGKLRTAVNIKSQSVGT